MKPYKIPRFKIRLIRDGTPIKCADPVTAAAVLRRICCEDPTTETMVVLFLDGLSQIRGSTMVALGGRSTLCLSTAEVFRPAIVANAHAIVLGHNHPSGSTMPSMDDDLMTKRVQEASEVLGVPLVDHVIVTEDDSYSYQEAGKIDA